MKVLFITNQIKVNKTEALKWFQFYCEKPDDLHIYKSPNTAKDFLAKVIEKQKHLDFIITDWNFGSSNPKSLLNWIRDSEETYSDNNFLFRSIPVLLIEDLNTQSSTISAGFDGVVTDFPTNILKLRGVIKTVIKNWRYTLADDLDLIGLDPKTQIIYTGHRVNFISYYRLKIISRKFVDNKTKKLNYIWSDYSTNHMNNSNEAFFDKMERTIRNPPKYLEKEFHKFFLANPTFIKGEEFINLKNEMLYEKHLYKDSTKKYDEPDFINKPQNYSLNVPEIFEIKRQSQKLLTKNSQRFLYNAKKSFLQVKRYKEYFTSNNPNHQKIIIQHLGRLYDSYDYTLLMGSKDEKSEQLDLIEQLRNDFEFDDINLITYEELLERHVRLCNRMDEFDIFK